MTLQSPSLSHETQPPPREADSQALAELGNLQLMEVKHLQEMPLPLPFISLHLLALLLFILLFILFTYLYFIYSLLISEDINLLRFTFLCFV